VKMESTAVVKAPPEVVFRFYRHLDHLRFVCTARRQEWCPNTGLTQEEGEEYEVRLRQGRHEIKLRFRTVRMVPGQVVEDEFLSWPLRGARRVLRMTPQGGGQATAVVELNHWEPPWFARAAVKERSGEQQQLFDMKLENAKRIIEAVYKARGEDAFQVGIFEDASALGIAPVVPPGE
jgi:hypothetical protein